MICLSSSFADAISATYYQLDSNTIAYIKDFTDPDPKREKFHGWYINASKKAADAKLVQEFLSVVETKASYRLVRVMCFQPGLGLSLVKDGKTYDYLVCLSCSNVESYVDGEQILYQSTLTPEALTKIEGIYGAIWGKKLTTPSGK